MTFRLLPALLVLALVAALPLRADLLIKDGQKVVFLGDSITAYGWGMPGGYIKLVMAGLATEGVKIEAIPAGVAGNTSKDMMARFDASVLSKKPDWMTLSCGVNDVWHGVNGGVDLETYKKNITDLIDRAQAGGIKVMILTATVVGEDLSGGANQRLTAYNDFLRKLAKDRKLPLADLNPGFQDAIAAAKPSPGSLVLTIDGVHPTPEGHRIMARGILKSFGVPDGDFTKIDEAWNAIPGGGTVSVRVSFNAAAPMTFADYDTLKKKAVAQGVTMPAFSNTVFLQAIQKTVDNHAADASMDMEKVQIEINQAFAKQMQELIASKPVSSSTSSPPSP